MSYDIYLEVDAGGAEPVEAYWCNHTSNTAVMWREAGCDLAEFHGKSARSLAASLSLAIDDMEFRPSHYAQWNPPNGWGSVETCLEFLRSLKGACDLAPLATVRVWR